jgi:hypothetical protein
MIRSLRRRHFLFALLMIAGLPGMVIHGYLSGRKDMLLTSLPKLDNRQKESFPLEVWHKPRLWKNYPGINTRLVANTWPDHALAVELSFEVTFSNPDLLLYWSPRAYSAKSGIGEAMHLLGPVAGTGSFLYRLPSVARHRDGFLLIYSLAQDHIVTEAPLVNPLKGIGLDS